MIDTPRAPKFEWARAEPVPQPILVDIDSIAIPKKHRKVTRAAIPDLARSIQRLGLLHLPAVWRNNDGGLILAAGRHRLEACKLLGLKKIRVHMVGETVGRAWTSSENIHRVGLTKLREAEELIQYEKSIEILKGEQCDHPRGGIQPHDKGNSRLASAAKISRKRVRQCRKWAAICNPAKKLLKANGLDNDASVLNMVAAKPGLGQLTRAKNAIDRHADKQSGKLKTQTVRAHFDPQQLEQMKTRWDKLKYLRPNFEKADPATRKKFADYILHTPR